MYISIRYWPGNIVTVCHDRRTDSNIDIVIVDKECPYPLTWWGCSDKHLSGKIYVTELPCKDDRGCRLLPHAVVSVIQPLLAHLQRPQYRCSSFRPGGSRLAWLIQSSILSPCLPRFGPANVITVSIFRVLSMLWHLWIRDYTATNRLPCNKYLNVRCTTIGQFWAH